MHIILGGNGHVGSALARTLLLQGEPVTIISRNPSAIHTWQERGAQVEIVDVNDTAELHRVFTNGKRLFLLNPPADPAVDPDVEERKSLASILTALDNSGLEKIVAESTYGAQPGHQIGDLGVLYDMEQQLATQPIPFSIIRAAYYMSNWDFSLQTAKQDGMIYTFFPADFVLPMVAPHDIGQLAARLMTDPVESVGVHHIEGPKRYSALDVAEAFAMALKNPVRAVEIPRDQWVETMQNFGFSSKAAESFANMTSVVMEATFLTLNRVKQGSVSLESYVAELVRLT